MTSLIIGSGGQDGPYLAALLEKKGHRVVCASRSAKDYMIDVRDRQAVESLVRLIRPEFLFNLAAVSATSHHLLFEHADTISLGTLNILEAVRKYAPQCRVFLPGSGLQFINDAKPISEKTPFHAGSSYALARIHSVYAARYYRSMGLPVYVGYFFNHDSPRRSARHVTGKIADYVRSLTPGGNPPKLLIGNVDVKKEWGFAGDIMEGVWQLVSQQELTECTIGTGEAYSIADWLEACFRLRGLRWQDFVETDDHFVPDYRILVSDPATIRSLGWRPEVSFEQLAEMMVNSNPGHA